MTRNLLRALAAVVVLATAALIGWRVLGPAEVIEVATEPYPVAVVRAPGVAGKTTQAPLIVDGRIRVYAGKRLVKADGPVDFRTMHTPRWSFRRWPAQVSGVVAVGTTVVSRWTDGELVALDGRTGTVAWRAGGPAGPGFAGRTGAAAVWAPPGLHVAGTSVLVAAGQRLLARSAADGSLRWTADLPPGCADNSFVTAGGRFVCGTGAWDVLSGAVVRGWPSGPSTPVGCDVARSACGGLRDASGQGWLTGDRRPHRATALDQPGTTAAGGLVLATSGDAVTASGAASWSWPGNAQVLGVRANKVVLLTATLELVTLDAQTGRQLARFAAYTDNERVEPWKPHLWQVTDAFVALERLRPGAGADPDEHDHYYTIDPEILAAI
ncbi:outer membrane protein assembly factor BamB family protein [Couchioplanes caeruleus]|uniref:outer membrane protein assembly factor BamB family protein n=1 Tax=Couchioplanes caeruleus TaxID=56438 RepID=UPI000A0255D2|nr:PQQ-binding-like beta-propeller repeat protein [Couchioplanes caeruleus]